jgi:D-3-phosphoglycerate dehydrogenase
MYSVNMPVIAPEVLEELRDYLPLAEDLGRFSIQLLKGRITDISITYCGSLLKVKEFSALTNAALKGILDPILTEGINLWNAPVMAKNMGIRITEGRREDAGDYQNMIILKVNTDEEETEIKGALLGEEARIVGIEGYTVDLAPKGEIMLVKHEDRPGMIGRVALSLGENNINIGLMQVGRKEVGGIQLMVLTVDQKIPKDVLSAICAIKGIEKVKMVEMP